MNPNCAKINRFVRKRLLPLFGFAMPKRAIYSKKDLLALLLNAGLPGGFAEGTSNTLEGLLDADTLLGYIKTLKHDDLVGLFERQVEKNFGLLAENGLLSRPVPVAIDWFDWMFYGDPESAEMVTGTTRKKGSKLPRASGWWLQCFRWVRVPKCFPRR